MFIHYHALRKTLVPCQPLPCSRPLPKNKSSPLRETPPKIILKVIPSQLLVRGYTKKNVALMGIKNPYTKTNYVRSTPKPIQQTQIVHLSRSSDSNDKIQRKARFRQLSEPLSLQPFLKVRTRPLGHSNLSLPRLPFKTSPSQV